VTSYSPEALKSIRDALGQAIKLKPDFPESYHLLAFINLVADQELDASITLIKRALALAPGSQQYALILAQLYLRQQNFAAARAVVEPLTRAASDPQLQATANSLLNAITSVQNQMALFKAQQQLQRETFATPSAADGEQTLPQPTQLLSPPRLVRNTTTGADRDVQPVAEPTPESMFAAALNEALRKPQQGEARLSGLLVRVDCSPKGMIFTIKDESQTLKLRSNSFEDVIFMAFTNEVKSEIRCGVRDPTSSAVITYRLVKDAREKIDGELVAVEFVPRNFKLQPSR
jgi:tetratricopeptide (TPR) repeat protein